MYLVAVVYFRVRGNLCFYMTMGEKKTAKLRWVLHLTEVIFFIVLEVIQSYPTQFGTSVY